VLTAVSGGSKLVIYVVRAAHSHDLALSLVAGQSGYESRGVV
jgi:hypothetical protein